MRILSKVAAAGLAGAAVIGISATTPAQADESAFLARFEADWSGGGKVLRRANEEAWNVTCTMTQNQAANTIDIGGNCRAALVLSKAIGAKLKVDPATGIYKGTYVGAAEGTAQLSGKRSGDTLTLTITWPKAINGDTKATMIIRNPGNGTLQIKVLDKNGAGGPTVTTSDLTFTGA
jgi:hypothetical protein